MLNRIYDLQKKKTKLMEEIYEITLEQSKIPLPEKIEHLLAITDRRQEHINSIDEINAELLPLEKEISNCPKKLFTEVLEGIRTLGEKAELFAEKIRKLEERNIEMVSGELQILKNEIKLTSQRKGSYIAYRGGVAQANGHFIDHKK